MSLGLMHLGDVEVDDLIEAYKEAQKEIERLNKLRDDKIERIKHEAEQVMEPIVNTMGFIENQLQNALMLSKDKKETKTMYKKKFISGEVQVKKAHKKIVNPKYDGNYALTVKELKDYCEARTEHVFKWGEFKKKLVVKGDSIFNKETGEEMNHLIELENVPEKVVIK